MIHLLGLIFFPKHCLKTFRIPPMSIFLHKKIRSFRNKSAEKPQ
uniref:Uncharacterized protein n=1 Tax=virus sp. ctQ5V6 TaxID=2825815 RepID=A0A8S5RQ91_9VIRU|nr:MAG TPA: hypothetical protein [virus sp. ctQ5V6]